MITLSSKRRIFTCKWVYKIKDGASPPERVKYIARVVAWGFRQRESTLQ